MELIIKSIKVEFCMNSEKDRLLFHSLHELLQSANAGLSKRNISCGEILKMGVKKIKTSDLQELRRVHRSEKEVLKIWVEGYNIEHDSNLSAEEFIVKILPKLKSRDLRKLEKKCEGGVNSPVN